ncbi:hypothetical protein HMPREF9182_0006 [Streptococcus sp. oral taxon 056 str. F0418]|nr:hypothetical protein HMPREF9182_0006 [Streptococcus sp. oral taxon 056 str. F0418]
MEEVNQKIRINRIIHEDSQFDSIKDAGEILEERDIILDSEEHLGFVWITSLEGIRSTLCLFFLRFLPNNPYKATKKHPLLLGDVFIISF